MKSTLLKFVCIGAVASIMVSCGGATEDAENANVTYTLDAESSKMMWKGDYADDSHSHNGTVDITAGTIAFEEGKFTEGSFVVDMSTLKNEQTDKAQHDTLNAHLNGGYFFNTAGMPEVNVIVNNITDKEIDATIEIGEKKIPAKFPATIKKDAKGMTANAKFTLDLTSMDAVGFMPNPETEKVKPNQFVKPTVEFELKLKMKAEAAE